MLNISLLVIVFIVGMACIFSDPYVAIYNRVPHKEVKPGKKQVADFHYIKTVGEGSFAAVIKVNEKETDREFAMKILEKNVIHRDIKPENILLDSKMHIKMTDFGTAGKVSTENPRRKSFVGTAQYVAPELLGEGEKYTCKESDLWAVGCVLYQFISGHFPFSGNNDWAIFQLVKKVDYKFDEGFPGVERDFIERLLVTSPAERLGSEPTGGIAELKRHEVFSNIDWDNLHTAEPPKVAPYLPPSGSENGSFTDDSIEITDFEQLSITVPKKLVDNRQSLLSQQAQRQPRLNKHLNGNELIVKAGIINKRRGLSRKKRHLILTDYPSIYYIDPASWMLKGEIPWEGGLEVRQKGKKHFQIHIPNRIYYLESSNPDADEWSKKIEDVKKMVSDRQKT